MYRNECVCVCVAVEIHSRNCETLQITNGENRIDRTGVCVCDDI